MTLLFFMVGILMQDMEPMAVDEFASDSIDVAHQIEQDVLFVGSKGMGVPMHHFSFETEKVTEIRDGRITAMLPYIFSHNDQFVLLNIIGNRTLFYLDRQGQFIKKESFPLELDPGEFIACAEKGSKFVWISLYGKRGSCLVRYDPERNETTRMPCVVDEDYPKKQWFEFQDQMFMVTPSTGEILLLDSDFNQDRVIHRGIEPVLNSRSRREKYYNVLVQPVVLSERVSLKYRKVRSPFGEVLEDRMILGKVLEANLETKQVPRMIIAQYKDGSLEYDWDARELVLVKEQ